MYKQYQWPDRPKSPIDQPAHARELVSRILHARYGRLPPPLPRVFRCVTHLPGVHTPSKPVRTSPFSASSLLRRIFSPKWRECGGLFAKCNMRVPELITRKIGFVLVAGWWRSLVKSTQFQPVFAVFGAKTLVRESQQQKMSRGCHNSCACFSMHHGKAVKHKKPAPA